MLVLLRQGVGSADTIADAGSNRSRGRGNLCSDSHAGLFPSAEDELGFWPRVQEGFILGTGLYPWVWQF